MSRVIPNKNSYIGFTTVRPANLAAPTENEIDAATRLTKFVMSLNPSSSGQSVPTPDLESLFNSSIGGTSDASFTGDFYRDDDNDIAWETLPRGTEGYFFVSRFGGTGTNKEPRAGQKVEVWPVQVNSRTASAMTTGQVQTFTINAAVPEEPEEDAVVAAGTAVPSVPLSLEGFGDGSQRVVLDWDAPASNGGSAITGYKVFTSATENGVYAEVTTNIDVTGTTAELTSVTVGTRWFKVLATNANGDGPQTAAISVVVSA